MRDAVLLITGGSTGIGAATARAAVAEGWRVALAARTAATLDSLVDELGGQAIAITCDVTDKASQQAMVNTTLDRFGRIDAVFANAGIGGKPGGFTGADSDVWKDMILTNVYGVGLTIQCTAQALKASRGHLLITGSAAGRVTIPGSMYSATKWAVSAIGYGVREELRGTGVRTTLIEPGMVDTPFFDDRPEHALSDRDIAASVMYALSQPAHVDVNEILVRPTPPIDDD
ncbi:SDR family oxidoreductase [Salinisphaera sp. LB1]|uniref:SDR family oxidoreductase n=1 Tax=Salinisphaera sp. LB1 TaxID=2183911 RepID=UPI000D7082AF|nr:SDR family NAD(P)-dependent oxidoreductase [Salinisphaera sp. LB1]AWN16279.1 Short-chain dehydrogenase/reductase SDR [Salinisphaera sp. LB1]